MVSAALLAVNHTNDRYFMSNQYPQPTAHQPRTDSYPLFCSLRKMNNKRKGLRVSFAFFQRNYLPDGRVNETNPMVEELSGLWKSGEMDGIPPFVMNCICKYSYLFFCLISIVCLCNICCFFENSFFLFPFMTLSEK